MFWPILSPCASGVTVLYFKFTLCRVLFTGLQSFFFKVGYILNWRCERNYFLFSMMSGCLKFDLSPSVLSGIHCPWVLQKSETLGTNPFIHQVPQTSAKWPFASLWSIRVKDEYFVNAIVMYKELLQWSTHNDLFLFPSITENILSAVL